MATTSIQWTNNVWNPLSGCTRVSAGCDHCYAVRLTHRLEAMGQSKYAGLTVLNPKGDRHFNGVVRMDEEALLIPFGWRKPRRIFVNSMSDLFHDAVPVELIARVFAVMGLASWHTFQVLTKRPERMARLLTDEAFQNEVIDVQGEFDDFADEAAQQLGLVNVHERLTSDWRAQDHETLPLPNVWLGTSIENQQCADERIPQLLRCPAAVRFLSAEPLLGPLNLFEAGAVAFTNSMRVPAFGLINWVIVGGESGAKARPFDVAWARSLIQQCKDAGVACFVKQLGANVHMTFTDWNNNFMQHTDKMDFRVVNPADDVGTWRGVDGHGGDIGEWAEDLRVRQFPEVKVTL